MSSKRTPLIVLLAGVALLAACGSDEDSTDDASTAGAETSTTETTNDASSESDATPGTLAEAIAGDVSWGWEPFRDRATADPDGPELPRMRDVFVVDGSVWATGRTDPPIGEDSEPVTAVIDPEDRTFELFETPGFATAIVHDGVMWGFDEAERSISTFEPETGTSEPVVVPEIAALLDATTISSPYTVFVPLDDGRLFLQIHRTIFELDADEPGEVLTSFEVGDIFDEFDEFASVHAAPAGDTILYDWFGENQLFTSSPDDDQPTTIDSDGPQAEVLTSADLVAWHRGTDLIVLDPGTGEVEVTSLTGAPTEVPSDAVRWDEGAVSHLGDDNNPALHLAGAPDAVVAATAKRDEVVLVDMATGSMVAVGHLYGDLAGHRPLVVGDELWLWSRDGQGILILSFGPPLPDGEGPEVVGEAGDDSGGDDSSGGDSGGGDDLADDPEYRSGRQQGRWDAEADLDGGWPADNDPDNYDPSASPEFKAGYVDGYDETYAEGAGGETDDGDTGGPTEEPAADDDECAPGESLAECYG